MTTEALYPNNLKNRFLTSSGLPHHFRSHSRLASRQWSFAPNKNSEDPPCQNPDSSSCLGISSPILQIIFSYVQDPNITRNVSRNWRENSNYLYLAKDLLSAYERSPLIKRFIVPPSNLIQNHFPPTSRRLALIQIEDTVERIYERAYRIQFYPPINVSSESLERIIHPIHNRALRNTAMIAAKYTILHFGLPQGMDRVLYGTLIGMSTVVTIDLIGSALYAITNQAIPLLLTASTAGGIATILFQTTIPYINRRTVNYLNNVQNNLAREIHIIRTLESSDEAINTPAVHAGIRTGGYAALCTLTVCSLGGFPLSVTVIALVAIPMIFASVTAHRFAQRELAKS